MLINIITKYFLVCFLIIVVNLSFYLYTLLMQHELSPVYRFVDIEINWLFSFSQKQDQIESAMDEIANNCAIVIGDTEEACVEARRLVSQAFFNATNTRNSGEKLIIEFDWNSSVV